MFFTMAFKVPCKSSLNGTWSARSLFTEDLELQHRKLRFLAKEVGKHSSFFVQEVRGTHAQFKQLEHDLRFTHFVVWTMGTPAVCNPSDCPLEL